MSNNWLNNIKHVAPGEPVQAGVVSRPDRTLADRTEYLRQRLDAAELGRAVFDLDATVSPDVKEGQPVYWNGAAQRYELALVAVENDPVTHSLVMQPSSECVGLCFKKKHATLGDIVLQGIVQFPPSGGAPSPLANAITGNIVPGKYYLSAAEPGKLVKQRPPATVSVCHILGAKDACTADTPWVIVSPQTRDFLEDHIHYRFELVTRPAGGHDPEAAAETGRHTITNPESLAEGWLPADHESFRRNPADPTTNFAPRGAAFGYNLKQHPALSNVWPPMPLQAVAVLWDKGIDKVGATEVPLGIDTGLCVVDANGIWWMSDCYGDVPWPATLSQAAAVDSESLPAQLVDPECPRYEHMRVSVVFLRMVYGNDKSVVTSLRSGPTRAIRVTSCDTNVAATTGDLQLDLDLNLLVDPVDVYGGRVLKQINDNNLFRGGWVAEGLCLGNSSGPISVTSTYSRPLTTTEKTRLNLAPNVTTQLYQGILKLNYTDALIERELSPQIIRLSDVVERLYKDIPYLGFPKSQDSLVRMRLNVPSANLGANLRMKIRAQLFGRGGTAVTPALLPALQMSYRRLQRPGGAILTPTIANNKVTDVTVVRGGAGYTASPTIVFNNTDTGATVSAAAAATVSQGVITAVSVTNQGAGYTSAPAVSVLGGSVVLPGAEAETALAFDAAKSVTIDTVIEIESGSFVVNEGDTILVTLGRSGSTDSYAAEVGLLRLSGVVYVPETV